ncbi:MAG TPA: hypothetical protein DCF44_05985 [Chitinophagaceae bacterium]|nr:hypothetical protein [Chitinophagaceae bacterium]
MKERKILRGIGILMIISELMLSVFVFKWLYVEYRAAGDALNKSVEQEFARSEQQFVDSVLVNNVIIPLISRNDSLKRKMQFRQSGSETNSETVEQDAVRESCDGNEGDSDSVSGMEIDTRLSHLSENIAMFGADSALSADLRQRILMKGTELFLNEVCDIEDTSGCFTKHFIFQSDTLLFRKLLSLNLAQLGLNTSIQLKDGNRSSAAGPSALSFKSLVLGKSVDFQINGIALLMVRSISSQLFFIIVLLLLTGISFWVAFRNMKNQMQLNMLKNEFISNITHELKTPVSIVKLAVEALNNLDLQKDERKMREYLEISCIEINRLELLIDKVMSTSSLETDKQLIRREPLDLKVLLEHLLSSSEIWFLHHDAGVILNAPEDSYPLYVDALHVEGIFKNLLDNSFKYANRAVQVNISLVQDEDRIMVTVSDNGPGIPDEYLNRVFDKFFRIPTGDKHNIKGYGLGLSYAALVMRQHGGTMEVRNNKPGHGCTFTLQFPKLMSV